MKKLLALLTLAGTLSGCRSQSIEEALETWNSGSVPYVQADSVAQLTEPLFLDTRSREEFLVSRIPGAAYVGYREFDADQLKTIAPDPDQPIVVYCSIGVRSEKIGERLQELGYRNVRNLYGGIFRWKASGHPVVDEQGAPTEKVHAYNKRWGKLLQGAEKVYSYEAQ